MESMLLKDRKKELRTLANKIMAFPEEDWTRERKRVAELTDLIVREEQHEAA